MAKLITELKYDDTSIQSKSTLEFFRFRPEMFLGALNLDSNIQCMREAFTNGAIDEALDVNRIYPFKILLFKGKDTYQFVIIDRGRGIAMKSLAKCFTQAWTSGKYDNKNGGYRASSGAFGCGMKVVTAVSKRLTAITKRMDGFAGLAVEEGVQKRYEIFDPIDGDPSTVGMTVIHQPDNTILPMTSEFWNNTEGLPRFLDMLDYMASFKPNIRVVCMVVDHLLSDKWFQQSFQDQWVYLQKITGKVIFESSPTPSPMDYINRKFGIRSEPVWVHEFHKEVDLMDDSDNGGYDIMMCCGPKSHLHSNIVGTVNMNFISRYDSSHFKIVMNAFKRKLKPYLDEEDDELRIYFEQKYILPIYGYIQILWKDASFVAQTKDNFICMECESVCGSHLQKECDKVPDEQWELLYELIKDEMYEDFARATNRSLNLSKSMKNLAASLNNDCFTPCRLKDPAVTELFITEGDSAGNWVKQARDPAFQAVLKLRGKPLNAFDADQAKIKANAVLQDMFRIIGVSPRDTDLSNMNFAKIGILADADPDGYHIVCLTLGNLYKINPLILQQGRVFIANPPLYEMETHDSSLYLRDAKALNDVRVKIYANYLDIYLQVYNQRELESVKAGMIPKVNREPKRLTNESYRDFVYVVNRIGTIITELSNRLAIEPILLEQLIHCVDDMVITNLNTDAIRDKLQITDCVYNELANTLLLIDRDVETTVQLSRLVSEIRGYILPLLEEIHWRNFDVLISTKLTPTYNKTPQTFYQIYQIFKTIDSKFNMHIHKGLGSTPVDILKVSCCDPKTRSSSIITNIGDVTEFYRMLGSDPAARKQLIRKDLKELQVPDEFIDQI